jgi:hypothetical protein
VAEPVDRPKASADSASAAEMQSFDEAAKKGFDFASETTKQVMGLSTGIIALTITFSKDFVHEVPPKAINFLVWAWLAYLLSIVFGIMTLMALTGTLQPKSERGERPSLWGKNVTRPAGLQIFSFLIGLVLTICFGISSLCPLWPFC